MTGRAPNRLVISAHLGSFQPNLVATLTRGCGLGLETVSSQHILMSLSVFTYLTDARGDVYRCLPS